VALLAQGLRQCPHLGELDLSLNKRVTWRGVAAIQQLLDTRTIARRLPEQSLCGPGSAALRELRLNGVPVGGAGAKLLADALQHNSELQLLALQECDIDAAGAHALGAMLRGNRALKSLLLGWNR